MKTLLLLLIALPVVSFGQDTTIKYSEVVQVEGTKDQLFLRGRSWFNDVFKSSKDVIQIIDKETGEISGKGVITSAVEYKMMGTKKFNADYTFSFKLFVKDGKYKYEASNFENVLIAGRTDGLLGIITSSPKHPHKAPPMVRQSKMDEVWVSAKQNLDLSVKDLVSSLRKAMSTTTSTDF